MSGSAWYDVALRCPHCGATATTRQHNMHSPALNLELADVWIKPGDLLFIGLEDLGDAFAPTGRWPPGGTMRALERWRCPACGTSQAAQVQFGDEGERGDEGWRLLSIDAVALTPELLASVHGVSVSLRNVLSDAQIAVLQSA